MSSILVYFQSHKGKVVKGSLCALQAARELKSAWKSSEIVGVTIGTDAEDVAKDASSYGCSKIFACAGSEFTQFRAVPYAAAMLAAARECGATTIVAAATSHGRDFMPRVAAALDAGQASDIVAVNADGSLKRPTFAGDILADVEISTPLKVVTVRASAFAPADRGAASTVVSLAVSFDAAIAGEFVSYEISANERPELSDAERIVSGGRALQSAENFQKYIFPLADALGAAVGASRAAVDSGYAPNDWQVGQTGKIVAPQLYVAVGISGAIQHLAGMKDSKTIVAINKDGDAPIYEVADFGLVGDLFTVLPELTEAVKRARGG